MPIGLTAFASGLWAGAPYGSAQNYNGSSTKTETALPGSGTSAPPGLEATLEFNDIVLHDRQVVDKYRVRSMDGLQGADIRDAREQNPSDHGETPLDNYIGGRTILIDGEIEAHNIGKLRDMQQALRTAFYTMTERPLTFHTGNIQQDVAIKARMIGKLDSVEVQDSLFPKRKFQITLRASDPRFRSILTRTQSMTFGLTDDFATTASLSTFNWFDDGNPGTPVVTGMSISAGRLAVSGSRQAVRNDLGYQPSDARQTIKYSYNAYSTVDSVGLAARRMNGGNLLMARAQIINASLSQAQIYTRIGGSYIQIATSSNFGVAPGTNYWMQMATRGNIVSAAVFTSDPLAGSPAPVGSISTTLAGGNATALGAGIKGDVGLRYAMQGGSQYAFIDDYTVEPLSLDHQVISPRNQGNFEALPKVRIYGPMQNVTVRNERLMDDETTSRSIVINGSIPAGRYYEYDAQEGTLYDDLGVNKFGQYDIASKQLKLAPGENYISIQATGLTGTAPRLDVLWQDTWI